MLISSGIIWGDKMSESDITARLEALERLRPVIQQGKEKLANSSTVDPQIYSYHAIVASANKAIQERFETESYAAMHWHG